MLTEQFQLIYKTLLQISGHPATFVDEKRLVEAAREALATADVKQMWICLVNTALLQGFHTDEKKIIDLAQRALKQLLLQIQMVDTL